jgi:CheY-like chemotaxis protein/HPt (histidine-containing phosphotransfer) domain-containing protein
MSGGDLEEELACAREQLELAKVRGEAFAHLSHEIRTLLSGVIGITGLLLDTELSAEQRDYAKRIRTSGDALLSLLNDILDFSKLEANKVEIERVDFDLRRTVDEVGELLAERAYRRGIELLVVMPEAAPPGSPQSARAPLPTALRGDPARLRQVLINLVSNAIKFTDQGEVVLKVASITALEDGSADEHDAVMVRFEVRDTGVGISPEGQARLFQPFSQVHDPARGYGGTGLGLAFAKRLVEAMGGSIGVESEFGKGSTFWFIIRLDKRPQSRTRNLIPRVDLCGQRVLLAVANEITRHYLAEMIEPFEIECVLAAEGAAALRLLQEGVVEGRPFDVILLDAKLNDMDGGAMMRAIDADERLTGTRMVAMTYPGQQLAAPDGWIAAHVAKPVRRAELQASLLTALGSGVETVLSARERESATSSSRTMSSSRRRGHGSAPHVLEGQRSYPATPPEPRPRVLLVEDNAVNQRVALMMVQKRGYDVDVVSNGFEALEMTARNAYDLVLMDCQMPKLDGFSATGQLRVREGSGRRTPVIAMTANAGPGAREKCLTAGMDDYLSKPIAAEELDRVLRRWAPRKALGRASTPQDASTARAPMQAATTPPSGRPVPARSAEALAPSSTSSAVIDPLALEKLRALRLPGEPDLAREVIELFLVDAPVRIAALRGSIERGDLRGVMHGAHTLKGSASHLGAKLLSTLCAHLEEKARAGAPFNAAFATTSIEEEFGRVRAALLKEVRRGEGGR